MGTINLFGLWEDALASLQVQHPDEWRNLLNDDESWICAEYRPNYSDLFELPDSIEHFNLVSSLITSLDNAMIEYFKYLMTSIDRGDFEEWASSMKLVLNTHLQGGSYTCTRTYELFQAWLAGKGQ